MADIEFSEYASGHWRSLVRSAVLLGSDLHGAEDLAQTALMRCYVSWAKVSKASDRDAYVARVLINVYRQSRRRHWWQERPTAELPETAEPDATSVVDGTETVRQALAHLSQAHREVVVLRFYNNLSEHQMADALGISPGTVKSRLSRALTHLSVSPELADLHNGGES
ncbi:MAG: sigE [Aeromicrobium sp.]|nr:sigE [Aeromicrobium sp.]